MTNKIDLANTKIRIKDEKHRKAIREALDKEGCVFYDTFDNVPFFYLHVNKGIFISSGTVPDFFDLHESKEVFFDMNTKQFSFEEPDGWKPEAGKPAQVKLGGKWFYTFIIGYDSEGDCVFEITDEISRLVAGFEDARYDYYDKSVIPAMFQPIKSEQEKFCKKLEEISEGILGRDGEAAKAIYNAIKSGELSVGELV